METQDKKSKKRGPKKWGPEVITRAALLAEEGFTNEQIAKALGICLDTFYVWKREHVEFAYAIQDARLPSLDEVEAALYRRALGYEYEEVTTETTVVNGTEVGEKKVKVTKKQMAPSETAQKFILPNRRKARWAEKIEAEVSGGLTIEVTLPPELRSRSPL